MSDISALSQPVAYDGLRLRREWVAKDTSLSFGSPSNFVNARLPDNARLDTGTINIGTTAAPNLVPVNPFAALEIQKQADTSGTYLNRWNFTSPILRVPASQKLVPVLCTQGASAVKQMMLGTDAAGSYLGGGLPIPGDYVPSPPEDTDAEAVFYQPDYVSPGDPNLRGRFYEAWKLRPNPAFDPGQAVSPGNPRWMANAGGRVVGLAKNPGHYVDWMYSGYKWQQPGHPDSTYQSHYWGVLASGLFIVNDMISREDLALGEIRHSIGLLMSRTKPGHRWPAQRNDGTVSYVPVLEGMRFRFPANMPRPTFSTELAGMIFDAAQRYGLVISDNTASSVGIRVESTPDHKQAPEYAARVGSVAGFDVLKGFPWSKLQVLAVGSDAEPNPV